MPPLDAAPTPVSAAGTAPPRIEQAPARIVATAALTTLADQAVFRLVASDISELPVGELFRFRRGSRLHAPMSMEAA